MYCIDVPHQTQDETVGPAVRDVSIWYKVAFALTSRFDVSIRCRVPAPRTRVPSTPKQNMQRCKRERHNSLSKSALF